MSSEISLLVGVGYALMTFFYVCMGTLAAQGRTTLIAIAFLAGAWGVAVPCAYLFAFKWPLTAGLEGLWLGLIAGYFVVSLIATVATCRSNWKKIAIDAAKRSEKNKAQTQKGSSDDDVNDETNTNIVGDVDLALDQPLENPVGE